MTTVKKSFQSKIHVLPQAHSYTHVRKQEMTEKGQDQREREREQDRHKREVMFKKMSVITVVKSCSFID